MLTVWRPDRQEAVTNDAPTRCSRCSAVTEPTEDVLPVPDQISLFDLPVLTFELTNSWEFSDPYGVALAEEKVVREWKPECAHPLHECRLGEESEGCGVPIGWALAREYLVRERARTDDGE